MLEVGGIATVWDLLVDGEVVRSAQSTFERHVVTIGAGRARGADRRAPAHRAAGELPSKPRQRWRTMLVEEARLRWVRTQVLGRAPGFSPGPPVVGPYRPVTLVTGPRGAERCGPGSRARPAWSRSAAQRVEFPDAELWWPHTHGTPRLHDVVIDGEVIARVGFRTVENRSTDGSLDLWVNGVRVFCRGAVWTPGDLAALDEAVGWPEPGPRAGHRGVRVRRVPRPLRRARAAGLAGPDVRDLRLPAGRRGLRRDGRGRGRRPVLAPARRTPRRWWSADRPSTSSRRRCSASARRPATPAARRAAAA